MIEKSSTKTAIQPRSFQETLDLQNAFFKTGKTRDLNFRKTQLLKFKQLLQANETKIYEAIAIDLRKSSYETYVTELSVLYNEIDFFVKKMNSLAKPKSVRTNILNQLGWSKIYHEPYGNTLVIGAWNYPFQLSLLPAVCALAAGNTVILKPSEMADHSATIMQKLINTNFETGLFHVFQGGVVETTEILKLRFDKIFFTGSPAVGKIIYRAAAEHLTPVTLELGGKSPAIVTASANIKVAAKRIVWGKFLNSGQTCIAPDYVYVENKVKAEFLEAVKQEIIKANYSLENENFIHIVNSKNFDRLKQMIDSEKVFYGGKTDKDMLFIEPTVLQNVNWEDAVMQEEIFGPILPVLSFESFDSCLEIIADGEKPLSAYLFSDNKAEQKKFSENISFGGGCINDTIMHFTNPYLPFGGVGNSGIGSYHGKYGFETFSHKKSILKRATWGEPNLKYSPYSTMKKKWMKRFL